MASETLAVKIRVALCNRKLRWNHTTREVNMLLQCGDYDMEFFYFDFLPNTLNEL